VSKPTESSSGGSAGFLPKAVAIPLAAVLILVFIVLLFPWDAVGRRIAWEISRVSGATVEVVDLSPGLSARGLVLRALDVTIDHPAVGQTRLFELEIAPRLGMSWFGGDPTVRVWAQTGLGNADGVLRLGSEPAYQGLVSEVELARLPLRLEASQLKLSGKIDAEADVALDPNGTLSGRIDFESSSLRIVTPMIPMPITFTRTTGSIEILETGATRITNVRLEGPILDGEINGEIGLVHRSQSPSIDLTAQVNIKNETLRSLAPNAGLSIDAYGNADILLTGTVDEPHIEMPRKAAAR
jgi:type II secretion system protein N